MTKWVIYSDAPYELNDQAVLDACLALRRATHPTEEPEEQMYQALLLSVGLLGSDWLERASERRQKTLRVKFSSEP